MEFSHLTRSLPTHVMPNISEFVVNDNVALQAVEQHTGGYLFMFDELRIIVDVLCSDHSTLVTLVQWLSKDIQVQTIQH